MKLATVILPLALAAVAATQAQESRSPQIFGAVKTRFEVDAQAGKQRFSVRNSRLGVRGFATDNMYYALQMELNSEGKFSVLDSYVDWRIGAFSVSVGQQQYHFSTELDRGAADNMFSNRSILGKFLTTYSGAAVTGGAVQEYVKDIGSRDMGILGTLRLLREARMPVKWQAGLFNGCGVNDFRWSKHVNVVTRLQLGKDKQGLNIAGGYYHGATTVDSRPEETEEGAGTYRAIAHKQRIDMWDAEVSYHADKFTVESEIARKYLSDSDHAMTAAYIHGCYRFPLKPNKLVHHIAPLFRWDMGSNVPYVNALSGKLDTFDTNRVTAGLMFGLSEKRFRSELRFNYEHYFFGQKPTDYDVNTLLHNRITMEFLVTF